MTNANCRVHPRDGSVERMLMKKLLGDLQTHPDAWPFMHPVNAGEVLDYYAVVKTPMGNTAFTSIGPVR